MMKTVYCLSIAAVLTSGFGLSETQLIAATLSLEPYVLNGPDGAKTDGELGTLMVPESRSNPGSRMIPLKFVRLPSTSASPGYPIIYLAGGPGGSAIRNGQTARFPFFNRLREAGDVILLDQRGAGQSNSMPRCDTQPIDAARPLDRGNLVDTYRRELIRCIAFWRSKGVAVEGYTTAESVTDLEDLRVALGADKLNLVGLSYGTHLGMAALKRGNRIGRVVFAGLEGLDQTVKLPAHFDRYFDRVAVAIKTDPDASKAYPDLPGMMRRVHARLDRDPVEVAVMGSDDKEAKVRLTAFPVQLLTGYLSIADPGRVRSLPAAYARMDAGDFQAVGETIYRGLLPELDHMDGMPQLMDLASGVSQQRLKLVEAQSLTAILGDSGNFPMPHVHDAAPELVLGRDFRRTFKTSVPTLLIMGTMDGRTPIESQEKLLPIFRKVTRLTVINGGHNIFEQSDDVQREIVGFLRTGQTMTTTITLPAVKFLLPKAAAVPR